MPVTFVTDLPGITHITLSNEDVAVIFVSWETNVNYGTIRIEVRQSNSQAWEYVKESSFDADGATFDLTSNVEYEVRVRTQTEHEESEWVSDSLTTISLPFYELGVSAVTSHTTDAIQSLRNEIDSTTIYSKSLQASQTLSNTLAANAEQELEVTTQYD